jgi:hypothetical protein
VAQFLAAANTVWSGRAGWVGRCPFVAVDCPARSPQPVPRPIKQTHTVSDDHRRNQHDLVTPLPLHRRTPTIDLINDRQHHHESRLVSLGVDLNSTTAGECWRLEATTIPVRPRRPRARRQDRFCPSGRNSSPRRGVIALCRLIGRHCVSVYLIIGYAKTAPVRRVMTISQPALCNAMVHQKMRQHGKLCRLVRRHSVTS